MIMRPICWFRRFAPANPGRVTCPCWVDLLREVKSDYEVDRQRTYLLGYSDGGFATIDALEFRTGMFAAGVPISGGAAAATTTVESIKDVPLWFFHGADDPVVDPLLSTGLAAAVQDAGGDAQVSLVPGGHNAGYEAAFDDPDTELFNWLLLQSIEPGTVPLAPSNTYIVRDEGTGSVPDGLGDIVKDAQFTTGIVRIGATYASDSHRIDRLVTKFDLPSSGSSETLASATLRIYVAGTQGVLAEPLSVFHSTDDGRLIAQASDYEDASYADTGLVVFDADAPGRQYYEVDVTHLVRADYGLDGNDPMSAFRLQADGIATDLGMSYFYALNTTGRFRQELVVSFVPEPSASLLALFAPAWLCVLRRR